MSPNEEFPITISREVAEFLLAIVNGMTLAVGDPQFEETVRLVVAARKQFVRGLEQIKGVEVSNSAAAIEPE
jgi:hypothetical protein